MEIKNLKKAAERIKKAIKNKERIILYGDADLDGSASVIILQESIKNLGGQVATVYFPDREIEGYGLSKDGLEYLKKFSPALLITLDCGISNIKEVLLAKKTGFSVIIIDHHEILDSIPKAEVVVDPKQKGDKYPFKAFAAAGLVFKLAELLLGDKLTQTLRKNFLELAALATIADMMPRQDDNAIIIEEGLKSVKNSWRPAIKVFFETEQECRTFEEKILKLITILNARDVENDLPASFRLLTLASDQEAETMIGDFLEKRKVRKGKIEAICQEIEERIVNSSQEPIIFEGSEEWDFTLLSAVASLICQKYKKPAFIFKILKTESSGTVRTPKTINSVELMKKCKKLLITYGGHPQASGFRLENKKLEEFKKCLTKNICVR